MSHLVDFLRTAPWSTLLFFAGFILVVGSSIGGIKDWFRLDKWGRIFAGLVGGIFLVLGLNMAMSQQPVSPISKPNSSSPTSSPPTSPYQSQWLKYYDDDLFNGKKGVEPLRNLLTQGKWREADDRTDILMRIDILGGNFKGQEFPCEHLEKINDQWIKISNGKFGFSNQRAIWERPGINKNYERFAEEVGWRKLEQNQARWLTKDTIVYNLNAKIGHLPWNGWQVAGSRIGFGFFMSRLKQCGI